VLAKSNNDSDILSATKFAVDNRLGDVISQSFGEAEACFDADLLAQQHEVFAEATRKNITLFASSGDQGAAQPSCDGSSLIKAVSTPASDPLVTAVGGTELHAARYCLAQFGCNPAASPAPGTYDSEIVWNEPNLGVASSGGGFSVLFNKPEFQEDAISNRGPGEQKARGVPDIAYNAAVLHGVLTFLNIPGVTGPNGGFFLFGGTSAGSPQWAAITAILDQQAGRSLGFINEGLYKIAHSRQRFATSFHDVTVGDNSVDGITGFPATAGWDASTGLGTPVQPQLNSLLLKFVEREDGRKAIEDSANHQDSGRHGEGRMSQH
jgi:subtilase family serine protease